MIELIIVLFKQVLSLPNSNTLQKELLLKMDEGEVLDAFMYL